MYKLQIHLHQKDLEKKKVLLEGLAPKIWITFPQIFSWDFCSLECFSYFGGKKTERYWKDDKRTCRDQRRERERVNGKSIWPFWSVAPPDFSFFLFFF